MEDDRGKTIGKYWDSMTVNTKPKRVRWWESPLIIRHINRLVCGIELDGFSEGAMYLANRISEGSKYQLGVSVGCGTGIKEMKLIEKGLVEKFILFELSEERIRQGKELSAKLGLSDRVTFYCDDAFKRVEAGSIDLVHWNNSLHHMLDVEHAVGWSYDVLREGGMFYMDDYVGPSRFQWPDKVLDMASRVREMLPDEYLSNPYYALDSGIKLSTRIKRPDPKTIEAKDPSEAADSDRITNSVLRWFPDAEIVFTGGTVYHLALSDVIHNFDEEKEQDRALLRMCMLIDEICTRIADFEKHYAVAVALKK